VLREAESSTAMKSDGQRAPQPRRAPRRSAAVETGCRPAGRAERGLQPNRPVQPASGAGTVGASRRGFLAPLAADRLSR